MGSTLIPHVSLPGCTYEGLHSTPVPLRATRLGFSAARSRNRRRKGRLVSFAAVDDDFTRQDTVTSTSSALEDRPGELDRQMQGGGIYDFLYPSKDLLPDDKEMTIFDHLEELRERIFVSVLAVGGAILGCFAFSKELIMILRSSR